MKLGSMFSGKSTEILRLINRYKTLKKNILAINHSSDTRYGENKIISHNKESHDCLSISELTPLLQNKKFTDCEVIFIEEAQFFSDLFDFVTQSADIYKKIVVVAGLDGTYKREPFGDVLRLIPHAESVIKLHALCLKCNDGTKASFTKRIINNESDILVGSKESYIAVCRKHYLE